MLFLLNKIVESILTKCINYIYIFIKKIIYDALHNYNFLNNYFNLLNHQLFLI
jgi:hypothetical protein